MERIDLLPLVNTVLLIVVIALAVHGIRNLLLVGKQITVMQGLIASMVSQVLKLADESADGAIAIASDLANDRRGVIEVAKDLTARTNRADANGDRDPGSAADAASKSG